jgi:Zn-dependent peptidase ImmA (M78 family)
MGHKGGHFLVVIITADKLERAEIFKLAHKLGH